MIVNRDIELTYKEYSLLERSLRGDVSLSQRLPRNLPMSKNQLIEELIEEISVYSEGEFEVFLSDGDLFAGHCIIVSGNINGSFESATIAG
ncbi:DUF2262 domain-containing protein [Clostridium sp. SHJSY1]|uniref:DUF2262 domain-containing protein n=1 Tax=Clostridium sp. SHJSY1 TaxID=2942483 RepID=UPI002876FA08|nr:DUF2262 domain-containing protein [Clostridium sp. SHJSY1]MDS0527663.1 DUF2262 domain-containing protein [Clostridium sp. SHJSY1]